MGMTARKRRKTMVTVIMVVRESDANSSEGEGGMLAVSQMKVNNKREYPKKINVQATEVFLHSSKTYVFLYLIVKIAMISFLC